MQPLLMAQKALFLLLVVIDFFQAMRDILDMVRNARQTCVEECQQ